MPCYHPLPAWYAQKRNPETGKRGVAFRLADGDVRRPLELPCGRCVGCQLERSRQWAVRCVHEAKLHEDNVFVTLTYDDKHLPPRGELRKSDFVEFMKRLRHKHEGVRFFQCGEYGEQTGRPHHHALLFNCGFRDARFYKTGAAESRLMTSEELDEVWGHGQCTLGEANFETAAYVARYTLKARAESVVREGARVRFDGKTAEYLTMSRRPGIGRGFVDAFRSDVYPSDQVVVRGVPCKPPRYYDQVEEQLAPSVLARVKARRRAAGEETARRMWAHEDPWLWIREEVKLAQVKFLKRGLEVA